jgi:dihydroorotate dehydrogenase
LGASLVELATGMIFGGPATIKRINKGLVELLEKDGLDSISQAVGSKNKL